MAKYGLNKRQTASTRNAKIIGVMVACICVCLAFAAGFLVRGDQALLKTFGFTSLVTSSEEDSSALAPENTYNSLSARIAEVEKMLKNDSLDTYDLDEATTELLTAFTEATHDEYLRYYDPERYAAYVKENSATYAGIGVLFSEFNGHAYVVDVFPGSVAESADVRVGDFVASVDGDRSQDWSLTEVVNAVSRDEGESVVITWRRPASLEASGGDEFTTTLVCSEYSEPNVSTELVDGVGYITLKQLTQNSADLTKKSIQTLSSQGAVSFVLDIRDNPGGYLTQAVEIASLFVNSGVIVGIETTEEHNTTKTTTGSTITDKPLVVLTNENTAAAAEVLAAALKDNNRATLVGHTTLGKGSVQIVRPLSFGGALRYTAAYYKTPLGQDINKIGVSPDILVDASGTPENDNQKNLAIETAQTLAGSQ